MTNREIRVRTRARLATRAGARTAFVYPGTSELAICAALCREDNVRVVNSRGDKEAVFFAAGQNLIKHGAAIAVLHGARGATNALGAIASVRRNKIPLLIIVGLPSRQSQRFLPPHAEIDLIGNISTLAKFGIDLSDVDPDSRNGPSDFACATAAAWTAAHTPPYGPVIVGVPQDLAEKSWTTTFLTSSVQTRVAPLIELGASQLVHMVDMLRNATKVAILVEDYVFRSARLPRDIVRLSRMLSADVFQVRYQRGSMLFQQFNSPRSIPYFMYDPANPEHVARLNSADLILTLEDRNMYKRVIGTLPPVRKIALTSNGEAVRKNEYAKESDIYVCDVQIAVADILTQLERHRADTGGFARSEPITPKRPRARLLRSATGRIMQSISRAIRAQTSIVVDDSQMFGGMFAQYYDVLLGGERVIGDHSGFVGSGLGIAVGVATVESNKNVWCFCGDQGFANGCQSLLCAIDIDARVNVIVWNNNGSASLRKQLSASVYHEVVVERDILANGRSVATEIARGMGCRANRADFSGDTDQAFREMDAALSEMSSIARNPGPRVLELVSPSEGPLWESVWRTEGFD